MPSEIDVVIIGAGVVGLAIAAEIAEQGKSVFVFEKNRTFGQETSSRNSEVIHAGIYYPEDSLKAKLCVDGNRLLYELCEQNDIPHKRLGKIILAISEDEIPKLNTIHKQALKNGVPGITWLSEEEIIQLEPNISGKAGLLSPSTGIIDSHALMQFFYRTALGYGAELLFEAEVIELSKIGNDWKVKIRDWEGTTNLVGRVVINCAGLESDKIAQLAGIVNEEYKLHYCKGEYFSLGSKWRNSVNRLIYPTPEQAGLGVHVTLSLDGMMRLGPNAYYVDAIDYKVDKTHQGTFYQSARKYLPFIDLEDLKPDFAGIRPKLQGPGDTFRDFVITREESRGLPGLINLIGIESPGLTASPAIARYVAKMVSDVLA